MSIRIRALCCTGFLVLWAASPAGAQEFSATVVTMSSREETVKQAGKVFVASGKVRLELPDFPDGYFLVDPAAKAAFFVRPARRVFMEARQSSRLAQILVATDPDNPCRAWQEVAVITHAANLPQPWQCTRKEADRIEGSDATYYDVMAPEGYRYEIGIDPKLKFPIRVRAKIGASVGVTDIQVGPQPLAAFEVPAGFTKFDPQGLIDRIKQSDVWVELPQPR